MIRRLLTLLPLLSLSAALGGTKEVTPPHTFTVDPYAPGQGKIFEVVPGKNSPWSFTIEPYLWALGMSGDVGVKGFPPVHMNYSPKTLLQNLNWGVMAKGEARYGRWGLLADGFFADLGTSGDPAGPLYKNATVTVQQGLAQAALAYRVWEDYRGFVDLYVGARYNYLGTNVSAEQDSGGIQQVGDNMAQRISDRLGAATTNLVDQAAASISGQLDARLDAARQAGAAQIAALQGQIQQAISQGKTADVAKLQALQSQVTGALQNQVASSVDQVDALKTQVKDDVRRRTDVEVVRRWADVPAEIRRLEDRRDLKKVLNPVRREFVDLVDARVQQQLAVSRAQVSQTLSNQLVNLAEQRVSAAEKLLATAIDHGGSDRAAAEKLLAASRAQLTTARNRADSAAAVDTSALNARVSKAEKQLAKAISNKLQDTLPTGGSADVWWVDPIVGIRAQVNLTRWLYLATQCDAGGFGAGSQIAWNLNGTVGINWSRNIFTEVGWRYYYVDYTKGSLVYQVAESGLFMGAGVKF